jgi:hypothetical protein
MTRLSRHRRVAGVLPQFIRNPTLGEGEFDVHVTVHRVKFLTIKPIRFTNFSNLFLE